MHVERWVNVDKVRIRIRLQPLLNGLVRQPLAEFRRADRVEYNTLHAKADNPDESQIHVSPHVLLDVHTLQ